MREGKEKREKVREKEGEGERVEGEGLFLPPSLGLVEEHDYLLRFPLKKLNR